MDSLEEIGALLGFIAFAGLAVLVFLTFQQARHIRRLRDWAGRAPERAAAEAAREAGEHVDPVPATGEEAIPGAAAPAATATAATGTGEQAAIDERERARERLSFDSPREELPPEHQPSRWDHFREELAVRWDEWDRRSPVDPKLIVAGFVAVILGVGIATGGFGLFGGSDSASSTSTTAQQESSSSGSEEKKTKVAVLNGTAPAGGTGVPGIADQFSNDVKDAGFKVELTGDAGSYAASVVMWRNDGEEAAVELAAALEEMIGEAEVLEMTTDVEAIAGDADVALVVGADDSGV